MIPGGDLNPVSRSDRCTAAFKQEIWAQDRQES
jgi:hypothetical protein